MKRLFIITSLLLMIVSCKREKIEIDSNSTKTFIETVDKISKTLPILQQDKFKEALQIVFEYKTNREMDNDSRWSAVRALLNGKSADGVFDLAEQIAKENKFLWSRNQVPLVNGIPRHEEKDTENKQNTGSDTSVQRFDFSINQDEKHITLTPFFYNSQGQEVQLYQTVTATIEVFNSGNIIYNFRTSIAPASSNELYRDNLINIDFSSLDRSKLKNEAITIIVRIPNTEKYLVSKKTITIPFVQVSAKKTSDSIANILANKNAINKEADMARSLSNRFINNLSKKNFAGAFALTRNKEWTTYQKFSSDATLKELDQSIIKTTNVLDADEKVILVSVEVNLNNNTSVTHQLTLEKIDDKLFIIDFK